MARILPTIPRGAAFPAGAVFVAVALFRVALFRGALFRVALFPVALLPVALLPVALFPVGPAAAAPDCADTAPTVRTCVTPGHTAITTSPNPAFANPFPGWGFGFGTPAFGLTGGGIWIGL